MIGSTVRNCKLFGFSGLKRIEKRHSLFKLTLLKHNEIKVKILSLSSVGNKIHITTTEKKGGLHNAHIVKSFSLKSPCRD